jgi:hypothetical protein
MDALHLGACPGRAPWYGPTAPYLAAPWRPRRDGEVKGARAVRCVGEQGGASEGDGQGDGTVDHQQPLPGLEASSGVGTEAFVHSGHDVARRNFADEVDSLVHSRGTFLVSHASNSLLNRDLLFGTT